MFVSSGWPVVFLQSMAVWCVVSERAGWLRNTPDCPQRSSLALLCVARPRGCRVSLFLSDTGPWRTHIANPLLYSNLLQALLHYCLARSGAEWTERASSGYMVLQPQNHERLVLASWSVHPSCLAVDPPWRSMWHTTAPLTSSGVSAGHGLVLLAHQEPWVNRGGFSLVLPQDRHHAAGRAHR